MRTAVVGGGAAGFFLAIQLKEICPTMEITIFERSQYVLRKVKVSGGGRCNCTNTFADVKDLSSVYPRGHRLMKRLMKGFDQNDAQIWFENHGVLLTAQEDQCIFPAAQDSQVIIDCFIRHSHKLGVEIIRGERINSLEQLAGFDFIALATGGQPRATSLEWLAESGHEIVAPVPSLFTFNINDSELHKLMGTVVENATVFLPGTKFRTNGPLLITHWGMSGPAILKLSSYAARHLAECNYHTTLAINWASRNEGEVRSTLLELFAGQPNKQLTTLRPFGLPARLWNFVISRTTDTTTICGKISAKTLNRIVAQITADTYTITGRAAFKEEFVTCGGVALTSVNSSTLESKHIPHLYFCGELLDIDGITGGFNFQAAWTTATTVARAIAAGVTQSENTFA